MLRQWGASMKKRFSWPVVILCVVGGILLGTQVPALFSGDNVIQQSQKLLEVLNTTVKNYVDPVDTQKLVEAAVNGMLGSLDPHSVYIPPEQMKKVTEDFQGSFEGVGIEFSVVNDTITVVQPIGGGPSALVGILSGDKIVKIEGKSSIGFNNDQVMKALRGPKGTKVSATIVREAVKEPLEFGIIRDKIPLYSVDVAIMVNNEVGYISVNRFAQTTHDEIVKAIKTLRGQGMKELILDLRANPGGYLDQAVLAADEFLPAGKKIVYTKGRRDEFDEQHFSDGAGKAQDIPLVVLISRFSASASEILAGAVQDWDRGLIVGETSFGKGLVQRQYPLNDGSSFRLTIARYYTPSGRLIQRPYSIGKSSYIADAMKRDEIEGENITHSEERDSTRPVYKTAGGRTVYGGGGITPDYIVKSDSVTPLSESLIRKNIFYEYTVSGMGNALAEIRDRYQSKFPDFRDQFRFNDAQMRDFLRYARGKGVEIKEDQYTRDRKFIEARLKATLARSLWGNDGWYSIMLLEDNQFEKAMTLFPEAKKIAGLR